MKNMRNGPSIMFGVRIPQNHTEVMELDRKNGNTLWQSAERQKLKQIYDFKTNSHGKNGRKPKVFYTDQRPYEL